MAASKKAGPGRYTVIRDTREHEGKGWLFPPGDSCRGTFVGTLDTADYTLLGYEDVFRLERKGSVAEFVANITQKEKWADFKAELERLEAYEAPFLVLEFDLEQVAAYPDGSGLPWAVRRKVRVKPQFFLKRLLEIELAFKTKIIPAGRRGKEVASSLFKRIVERWPHRTPPDSTEKPDA